MLHYFASACSLRPTSPKKLLMGLIIVTVTVIALVYAMGFEPTQGLTRNSEKIRSFEKTWTWLCEERHCVRIEWTSPGSNSRHWQSLFQCRITCGTTTVIWPKPTKTLLLGHHAYVFNPDQLRMKIQRGINTSNKRLLKKAFDIFKYNLNSLIPAEHVTLPRVPSQVILKVTVFLRGIGDVYLTLDTNESYRLELESEQEGQMSASIIAHTFYGARHALETLSQLIWWETNELGAGLFKILNYASVDDAPRFNYRGLMIDTSRNFMPMSALRKTINGMAASKLNTLHLHLTDSQSFSFESPRFPQMARYGAYSPDQVHSAADLKELAEYARLRGVRLLPEVDAPAHAGVGWQWGEKAHLGKLAVCINQQPWSSYCGEPPCGQLNPSNNNTYSVLQGIYQDLLEITQIKDLFHIGGDEVNMNCWVNSPDVFKDLDKVIPSEEAFKNKVTEFHNRAYQVLTDANSGTAIENVIVWSTEMHNEDLLRTFPKDKYIIQEWGGSTWQATRAHLNLEYRVILSHVDAWYLDCGFGSWLNSRGDPCGPVATWQKVYQHRPWAHYPPENIEFVLGGEVCLWSEKSDEYTIDSHVWPRASALGERLWSDPHDNMTTTTATPWRRKRKRGDRVDDEILMDAMLRLAIHRERLLTRGVSAAALWPQWCNDNPDNCS